MIETLYGQKAMRVLLVCKYLMYTLSFCLYFYPKDSSTVFDGTSQQTEQKTASQVEAGNKNLEVELDMSVQLLLFSMVVFTLLNVLLIYL